MAFLAPPRGALAFLALAACLLEGPAPVRAGCSRDQWAECNCLLSCKVFGGSTAKCSGSEAEVLTQVDEVVAAALSKKEARCEGIKCVMDCSRNLGCVDDEIVGRCLNVVQQEDDCDMHCDGNAARRGAGSIGGAGLLLAALLAAATMGS